VQAFNLGVRYSQSEDWEQAAKYYLDAWTVYDRLPQPMLQLGGIYAKRALTAEADEVQVEAEEKAVDAYRKALTALEQAPERLTDAQREQYNRAAAFNLAQLLALDERYEEAAGAYERFLALEPGNVDAMSNAAVVMVRAAQQAALQAEEAEDGPEKEALLARADSLQTAANAYYAQLLAREDLEAEQYHNIGLGLMRIGKYEDAAIAYNKALDLEPYRVNSLEQLARAYLAAERWDTLAAVAETLVERYPLSLDNLALLANAYRELERPQDALRVLEQREALQLELTDLELQNAEGTYTVSGSIHNLKTEEGAPLELRFDFYDDAGEMVASETATLTVPAQEERADFSVSTQSAALISGFTYSPSQSGQAQAGN
jgi:tetratricopeptide (TPR) repeat protein